jgi:RNA polymerase sigma factor (sigma-70 family)
LVSLAASGDSQAWDELVASFGRLVWATARAVGLDPEDAADVSQTTWLKLAEHIGGLRDPERVAAWLVTTTRREAIRVTRLESRTVPVDPWADLNETSDEDLTEVIERVEEATRLHEAIGELSGGCRDLLLALTLEPTPAYADVSARLGMPIGSIGPTRARCLAHLRALLADLGADRPVRRETLR